MSQSEARHDVAVIGSVNSDLVLRCASLPLLGESIAARGTEIHNGGKGANQAVALARLGLSVSMIGRVGSDADGQRLRSALDHEGVDTHGLFASEAPTGLAVILVDDAGDNMIIVNQGANASLSLADLDAHRVPIEAADTVLIQMEIPLDVVASAVQMAKGTTVLNPAPALVLGRDILDHVDYLIPNRTELGTLAQVEVPATEPEVIAAAASLPFDGTLVVTLGAHGAVAIADGKVVFRATPPKVSVVDTVGAGDAFCAGFAAGITSGRPLVDAVRFAVACGSHATTIRGAQPSMPALHDAERLFPSVGIDTVL